MKLSINFLREVRWTSLHVVALLVIGLGVYGVISFFIGLVQTNPFVSDLITNHVFWNDQRLTPEKALEQLTKGYSGNFATVIAFTVFMIFLSVHYFSVLRGLYFHAPLPSIIAFLFLGGSVLFGLLVGLALVRVNEFAFQVASAGVEQKEWLRTGIGFLIQIHLIFVYGWLLCTGLGWIFVGSGTFRGSQWLRRIGAVELVAGSMVVTSVIADAWMPMYGEKAPRFAEFLSGDLFGVGISLGLLASGVLFWLLKTQQYENNKHDGHNGK